MGVVLQEALTWYDLPLTVLLGVVVLYWLMVIIGVMSADSFDFDVDAGDADFDIGADADVDVDIDADVDISADAELGIDADADAGHPDLEVDVHHDVNLDQGTGGMGLAVLRFLNFGKVPAMVVISAFVMSLWFISMLANFAFNKSDSLILSAIFFTGNVLVSLVVTKIASAPLVPLFRALNRNFDTHEPIVGRECVILSVKADEDGGRAEIERVGAPFQIRVHLAVGREPLSKGDRALVADYDEDKDIYLIKQLT